MNGIKVAVAAHKGIADKRWSSTKCKQFEKKNVSDDIVSYDYRKTTNLYHTD